MVVEVQSTEEERALILALGSSAPPQHRQTLFLLPLRLELFKHVFDNPLILEPGEQQEEKELSFLQVGPGKYQSPSTFFFSSSLF